MLLASGCTFVRPGKGSHEIRQRPVNGARFPVAVTIVSRNAADAIFRQAGIAQKL